MEEAKEFQYLGAVPCRNGSMEGEVRERAMKGRQVISALSYERRKCWYGGQRV